MRRVTAGRLASTSVHSPLRTCIFTLQLMQLRSLHCDGCAQAFQCARQSPIIPLRQIHSLVSRYSYATPIYTTSAKFKDSLHSVVITFTDCMPAHRLSPKSTAVHLMSGHITVSLMKHHITVSPVTVSSATVIRCMYLQTTHSVIQIV